MIKKFELKFAKYKLVEKKTNLAQQGIFSISKCMKIVDEDLCLLSKFIEIWYVFALSGYIKVSGTFPLQRGNLY